MSYLDSFMRSTMLTSYPINTFRSHDREISFHARLDSSLDSLTTFYTVYWVIYM